jgi:hypothetical protein
MPELDQQPNTRGLRALEAAHAAFADADAAVLEDVAIQALREARAILAAERVVTLNTARVTVSLTKAWKSAPYSTPTLSLTAS